VGRRRTEEHTRRVALRAVQVGEERPELEIAV
jgi:hypothetical protein